jgi:hypothetical protein
LGSSTVHFALRVAATVLDSHRVIAYFATQGITTIERLITDNAWAHRYSLRDLCAAAGIKQVFIRPTARGRTAG